MASAVLTSEGLARPCLLTLEIELWAGVLAGAADGGLMVDHRGRIIYWNEPAGRILGFADAETVGLTCYELLVGLGESGEAVCASGCSLLQDGLSGCCPPSRDVSVRTDFGSRLWINWTTLVVPVDRCGNRAIVHLFHGVEQQMRLKEFTRRAASEALRLAMPDGGMPRGIREPEPEIPRLTDREREVLLGFARGESVGSLASRLSISTTTVRWYSQRILDKLGVHSRLQAVARARRHGLIPR